MGIRRRFDAEKALEVLLYVAARVPNMYWTLKSIYFADKMHLAEHGRLICNDSYVAMSNGPVPSGTYDIVKHVRGDGYCPAGTPLPDEAFSMNGYYIIPKREADLELLSESDVACLDAAIEQIRGLTFGQLKRLSHDKAHESADENDHISLEAIIGTLPDGDLILEHIQGN